MSGARIKAMIVNVSGRHDIEPGDIAIIDGCGRHPRAPVAVAGPQGVGVLPCPPTPLEASPLPVVGSVVGRWARIYP